MDALRLSLLLVLLQLWVRSSLAAEYTVGGPAGWTTPARARVNYTDWAAKTPFKVGDTLEFNYVAAAHSVLEVTRSGFRYCNKTGPLAQFQDASGRTAVELAKVGNYYFIDGVGQHCEEGQRFQAKVQPSPSGSISSSPSAGAFRPTLAPSTVVPFEEPSPAPAAAIAPAAGAAPPALSSLPSIAIGAAIASCAALAWPAWRQPFT